MLNDFIMGFGAGAAITVMILTTMLAPPDAPPYTEPVAWPGVTILSVSQVLQVQDHNKQHWWVFRYGEQLIKVPAHCKE